VLIIDEVGYLSYGPDAANVLFHVVNERHLKKRPMIFTTNKPLPAWGSVLHDADLAEAIIDRILERGRFIALDGPSSRTRHLKPNELTAATENLAPPQPARISGKIPAEFPEPTNMFVRESSAVLEHDELHFKHRIGQPAMYRATLRTGPSKLR